MTAQGVGQHAARRGELQEMPAESSHSAAISGSSIERYVGLTLLLLLAIGCFVVVRPFLSSVIWAAILSFSTWPVYVQLERILPGRKTLAALLMTLFAAAVLLLPIAALGSHLAAEVAQVTILVSTWMEHGPPGPPAWVATIPLIGGRLDAYWQTIAYDGAKLTTDLRAYVGPARQWVLDAGVSLSSGIGELVLSLLISFFLYRDGMVGVQAIESVLGRVAGSLAERLMRVAGQTIKSVVYGVIGTNLVEALLAALGLSVAGVPGALFLGFAVFFLTLIPIAPLLIFAPAIVWLIQQHAVTEAIFLGIWYILVFMILEGVLRAYLISRGGELPLILVLL